MNNIPGLIKQEKLLKNSIPGMVNADFDFTTSASYGQVLMGKALVDYHKDIHFKEIIEESFKQVIVIKMQAVWCGFGEACCD